MNYLTIKGVIFDFGGVISYPQNGAYISKIMKALNLNDSQLFLNAYRFLRIEYDSGLISGVEFWNRIINHFGFDPAEEKIQDLIEWDVLSWTMINRETIEYIKYLKSKNLKLAILSNMIGDALRYIEEKQDWLSHFEHRVFSCDLKMCKPREAIYRHCLEQMGLEPKECVFIDDTQENLDGATRCGINTIKFESVELLKGSLNQFLESEK